MTLHVHLYSASYLGAAHRDTLRSRLNLACLLADKGDAAEAERLCRAVVRRPRISRCRRAVVDLGAGGDQEATQTEAFGLDDPETLLTRYNLTAILHEAAVAEATVGVGGAPDVDGAPGRALASRAGRRPSHRNRVQELEASVKQVVQEQVSTPRASTSRWRRSV